MVIKYSKVNLDDHPQISKKLIRKMEKLGWQFYFESWMDRHKSDTYYELKFKSPNMKNTASIHEDEISETFLLEREARAISMDWANSLFNSKLTIQNPISLELEKYLLKNKSNKFLSIYASSIEFDVKISPENKNTPKKVKVTIEIL